MMSLLPSAMLPVEDIFAPRDNAIVGWAIVLHIANGIGVTHNNLMMIVELTFLATNH